MGNENFNFKEKKLIGMIHLRPLPGSPNYNGSIEEIINAALLDMEALIEGQADAFIIENFGDIPYEKDMGITAFAVMSKVCFEISQKTTIPFGLNVQYNNVKYEWAMALATNADFIRVEVFVENRVGVHGVSYASAPELMRLKKENNCKAMIFADINSKHSFPLVEQPMEFTISSAIESGADALIVTGLETGKIPTVEEVKNIKKYAKSTPVIIGSGVNLENIEKYIDVCDGIIVGSSIKKDGNVFNSVDRELVLKLSNILKK